MGILFVVSLRICLCILLNIVATLASGKTIRGCVLLACDGIHSRCRAVLRGGYDIEQDAETNAKRNNEKDPLHFCNAIAYWGKTRAPRGSALEIEFSKTQKASEIPPQ